MSITPPSFAEARRLFADYRYQRRSVEGASANLIAEAQKRLDQTDWIVQRLQHLQLVQDRIARWHWKPDTPPEILARQHNRRATMQHTLGDQIELLAESFYYFAWRLRQVLVQLPEFKNFDPTGLRDVRFHLLDHPEKTSKALNPNFMYGHDVPTGPVLKPFGPREIEIYDQGLYVNAQEMLDELLPRLRRAVGVSGTA